MSYNFGDLNERTLLDPGPWARASIVDEGKEETFN